MENEWEVDENAEWNEADYTLDAGKYVRMKRLLPGEQVLMSVENSLYTTLAVGDAVQPATGGTVAKYPAPSAAATRPGPDEGSGSE